jgi:hypothetical protein
MSQPEAALYIQPPTLETSVAVQITANAAWRNGATKIADLAEVAPVAVLIASPDKQKQEKIIYSLASQRGSKSGAVACDEGKIPTLCANESRCGSMHPVKPSRIVIAAHDGVSLLDSTDALRPTFGGESGARRDWSGNRHFKRTLTTGVGCAKELSMTGIHHVTAIAGKAICLDGTRSLRRHRSAPAARLNQDD